MTEKTLIEEIKELFEQQNKSHASTCPSCGHCPTCGRRNAAGWGWPYWNQPYYTPPYTYTVTSGATTTGVSISGNDAK